MHTVELLSTHVKESTPKTGYVNGDKVQLPRCTFYIYLVALDRLFLHTSADTTFPQTNERVSEGAEVLIIQNPRRTQTSGRWEMAKISVFPTACKLQADQARSLGSDFQRGKK